MNSKEQLISLIKDRMTVKTEAVTTSAGEQTTTYLDIPHVLQDRNALEQGIYVLVNHLSEHDLLRSATMVVGPMTGSIPLVMGLVQSSHVNPDLKWSIIRDTVKRHGLSRWFVGAEPGPGDKVIVVDDVASSGRSLADAAFQVQQTGAQVLAVVPLVDRGIRASKQFEQDVFKDVAYLPVLTYRDLGIEAL